MRSTMKWILVTSQVVICGLVGSAVASGAEFSPLNYANSSAYTSAQPTRVTMTNRDGQVTTLEYRKPVRVVSYEQESQYNGLQPVTSVPVFSTPAREEDLVPLRANYPELSSLRDVRYTTQQPITPINYTAPAPSRVVNYAPAPTYTVPNYSVPITSAPQTVYSPIVTTPVMPVANPNVQVSAGVYGQPVIYRPGQPVRNALRYLTP
ncbi:MAG TPA: hypothetical protein VL096_00465 [Pirellulaceae bacterium]|nr:hypothetical protein [Pirellulaceae bacterium]